MITPCCCLLLLAAALLPAAAAEQIAAAAAVLLLLAARALLVFVSQLRHTISEKRIFNAWSTKRSLFAKPFHGCV